MNRKTIKRTVAIVATTITIAMATSGVFAMDTETSLKMPAVTSFSPGGPMVPPSLDMHRGTGMMNESKGDIFQYFRMDMTDSEKIALKTALETHGQSVGELLMNQKNLSAEDFKTKMIALNDAFKTSVAQYIDSSKVTAFAQFLDAKVSDIGNHTGNNVGNSPMMNSTGSGVRIPDVSGVRKDMERKMKDMMQRTNSGTADMTGAIQERPQQNPSKPSKLPKNIIDQLNSKLDSVPTAKQETVYTAVIAKVDAIILKTVNPAKKDLYSEVRAIVQNRLDSLTVSPTLDEIFGTGTLN